MACSVLLYKANLEITNVTELIWDGKYKDGKKQGPVRIALPFQTIETVNESPQDRRHSTLAPRSTNTSYKSPSLKVSLNLFIGRFYVTIPRC
jgi:hypothetical protein